MSLTEAQAQQFTLIRVLEQTRDNGELWTAGDAKEATQATMALVPAKAPFDRFVARRAAWAVEEIGKRTPSVRLNFQTPRWPALAGLLVVALALAIGFVTDHLAADRRVNVVEYPLVLLILWNLLIFLVMLLRWIHGLIFSRKSGGILGELLGNWRLRTVVSGAGKRSRPWIEQFRKDWSGLAAKLNQVRVELVLHAAAMSFALGSLASLYVRGFFREYRAGWESTFFSAENIHAIASVVLTPGALLLNMQVPDAAHIATLRLPEGTGEIARDWIHLYAASILVWIILPRLLLTIVAATARWRLQTAFPLPMSGTYFATLRAVRRGGHVGIVAIPFRYELTPRIRHNLTGLLERIYGLAVQTVIQQPVLMGEDSADWKNALGNEDHIAVFVIFNVTATAEADTHGKLLKKILKDVDKRTPVIPIVDTGSYADKDLERMRQRCNQWRSVLDEGACKPLFLDLSRPDDNDGFSNLEARLNRHD